MSDTIVPMVPGSDRAMKTFLQLLDETEAKHANKAEAARRLRALCQQYPELVQFWDLMRATDMVYQ